MWQRETGWALIIFGLVCGWMGVSNILDKNGVAGGPISWILAFGGSLLFIGAGAYSLLTVEKDERQVKAFLENPTADGPFLDEDARDAMEVRAMKVILLCLWLGIPAGFYFNERYLGQAENIWREDREVILAWFAVPVVGFILSVLFRSKK